MAVIASKEPVWITLTVALTINSMLISFQTTHRVDTSFVRVWILDSLAPLEKLVDRTLHGTGSIWDRYFALIGVYDENQRLRSQNADLRIQLDKQKEDILEAERVRRYVGLDD